MKIDIFNLLNTAHPLTLIIAGILIITGVYKGIIKISWLNLPKKNKDEPCLDCINVKFFNETISKNIERAVETARIKFVETIKYQLIEAELVYI